MTLRGTEGDHEERHANGDPETTPTVRKSQYREPDDLYRNITVQIS
jgi:hypothetical protein